MSIYVNKDFHDNMNHEDHFNRLTDKIKIRQNNNLHCEQQYENK